MKGIKKIFDGGLKNFGTADIFSMGLNAAFTVSDIKSAKEEGYSNFGAITRGIGTNVLIDVVGLPAYIGYEALTGLPKAGIKAYEKMAMEARSMQRMSANKPFQTATFLDTPQAYTMRQAGMQMAKTSQYNTQQALLGNEAQYIRI